MIDPKILEIFSGTLLVTIFTGFEDSSDCNIEIENGTLFEFMSAASEILLGKDIYPPVQCWDIREFVPEEQMLLVHRISGETYNVRLDDDLEGYPHGGISPAEFNQRLLISKLSRP